MSSQDQDEIKEKFETLNRLLDDEYALVHIDPNMSGVIIPEHLKAQQTVTLKLSRLFKGGIEVSKERVLTSLLFQGKYFACTIPLPSIWGVTSDKGNNIVWPDSTPKTVLKQLLTDAVDKPPSPPVSADNRRGHLKRVK